MRGRRSTSIVASKGARRKEVRSGVTRVKVADGEKGRNIHWVSYRQASQIILVRLLFFLFLIFSVYKPRGVHQGLSPRRDEPTATDRLGVAASFPNGEDWPEMGVRDRPAML